MSCCAMARLLRSGLLWEGRGRVHCKDSVPRRSVKVFTCSSEWGGARHVMGVSLGRAIGWNNAVALVRNVPLQTCTDHDALCIAKAQPCFPIPLTTGSSGTGAKGLKGPPGSCCAPSAADLLPYHARSGLRLSGYHTPSSLHGSGGQEREAAWMMLDVHARSGTYPGEDCIHPQKCPRMGHSQDAVQRQASASKPLHLGAVNTQWTPCLLLWEAPPSNTPAVELVLWEAPPSNTPAVELVLWEAPPSNTPAVELVHVVRPHPLWHLAVRL